MGTNDSVILIYINIYQYSMWGSAMCCKNQQPIALLLSYSQCGFADRWISRDSQVRVSGTLLRSAHDTLCWLLHSNPFLQQQHQLSPIFPVLISWVLRMTFWCWICKRVVCLSWNCAACTVGTGRNLKLLEACEAWQHRLTQVQMQGSTSENIKQGCSR